MSRKALLDEPTEAMIADGARELLAFTTTLAPRYPERAGQFGDGAKAIYLAMRSSAHQEPDYDAEWLRELATEADELDRMHVALSSSEARRIANRLQAKAPETGEGA